MKMKPLLFVLLAMSLAWAGPLPACAQMAIGEWQAHMAYGTTSANVCFAGKVYALSGGSLFSYDPEDQDILTYDITNCLSDIYITHIGVCEGRNRLVIIYDNGNIDLMDARGEVYNMTDLKNSSLTDKSVNSLTIEGDMAYLGTQTGITVVNIGRQEIANTYSLGKKVNDCAIIGGYLLAAVPGDGLYQGKLTDNLLDVKNWKRINASTFSMLAVQGETLYGIVPGSSLLTVNPVNGSHTLVAEGHFNYLDVVNGKMTAVTREGKIYSFGATASGCEVVHAKEGITDISYDKGIYWISSESEGLAGFSQVGDKLEQMVAPVSLNAPARNLFFRMFIQHNRLYTCGGGIFLAPYTHPGTIQVLDLADGTWTNYDGSGIPAVTGRRFEDVTCLAVDPADPDHLFASTAGWGVHEFRDGDFVGLHDKENSTVLPVIGYPNITYTDGLEYDHQGNLWLMCASAEKGISIYTRDGEWTSLAHDVFYRKATLRHTLFDRRGWLWCVSPNHTNNGIFILDWGGTATDPSDDRAVHISSFYNQDGDKMNDVSLAYIHCLVEDKRGDMWVGTGDGVWQVTDPARLLDDGVSVPVVNHVKVPRNDGTNFADYLLDGIAINAIAVDGANRKWVGTARNGLFLFSEDGVEEIHHFTTGNSPLPSDEIQSIAIDEASGLVYVGTSRGLVSYQSDASAGMDSFEEDAVRAWPNPVAPDYGGYVRVTGLMHNSVVKITDAMGALIHEGVSVGGSFSWNGRDRQGRRVASGVYHVFAADEKGEEGIVTKIVMMR